MIPQGWQPIGEPAVPELSPDALRVKSYIMKHGLTKINLKTIVSIGCALRMGVDRVQDAVYEIRKQEAIIMAKFSPQQRAAIYQSWKDGQAQNELAKQYGVTKSANCQIITKLKKEDSTIEKPHPGVINKEFDAAVDEMIAENNAAEAEEKSVSADTEPEQLPAGLEDCENGIPNTPLLPSEDKLPPVVIRAVIDSLNDMEMAIEDREQRILELQMEIEDFRKDIAALKAWREAHA